MTTAAAAQQHLRVMTRDSALYTAGRVPRANIQHLINTAQAWLSRNPSAPVGDRALVQAAIDLGRRTLSGPGGAPSTARAGEAAASQKSREARDVDQEAQARASGEGSGSSRAGGGTPARTSRAGGGTPARTSGAGGGGPGGLPDLPARPVGLFTAIARTFTGEGDLSTLWVPPGSGFFERPLTQLVLLVGGALTVATVVTVIVAKSESKKDEE